MSDNEARPMYMAGVMSTTIDGANRAADALAKIGYVVDVIRIDADSPVISSRNVHQS